MNTKHLLLSLLALFASITADAVSIGGICYTLNSTDRTATVTYYSTNSTSNSNYYSGAIQIPSSVTYSSKSYSVIAIGASAFKSCTNITSVTLPTSITSIAGSAFSGCTNMSSVNIPSNVTSIGECAFSSCSSLSSITIPSKVTSMGEGIFQNCTGLTSVTMTSRVTSIPRYMFNNCTNLNSFSIPPSVISIEANAFQKCTGLSNISIPTSVTVIKSLAFEGCSNLTSVTLPASMVEIQGAAFNNCTYLSTINIPENVSTIGSSPVYKNENSYNGYSSYWQYDDDGGYKRSYSSPFSGCSSLKSFVVDEDNPYFSSVDGVLFNKDGDILYDFPKGKSGYYTIPSQVKAMNDEVLRGCDKLTGLCLSDDLWTPDNYFPFRGKQIKTFHIGRKLSAASFYASGSLPNLETITVDGENQSWWVEDGVLYRNANGYNNSLILYPQKKINTSFSVPEGINNIASTAMGGNSYIQNVSLPSTLNSIGSEAFQNCTNLRTVNIPASVSFIDDYAFEGCSRLESIDLSLKTTYSTLWLGNYCFGNCNSLKTIILGNALAYDYDGSSIEYGVFDGCNSIENIYVITDNLIVYGYDDIGEDYVDFVETQMFSNFSATVHVPSGSLSAYRSSNQWKNFSSLVADKSIDVKLSIDNAQNIWSNATEGDAVGQYEPGSKAALKSVIDEVQDAWSLGLADNICTNLLQQISNALATFESKKVTYGVSSTFMVTIAEGIDINFKILNMQQLKVAVASNHTILNNSSVTIPSTIQDEYGNIFNVTSIGGYAFYNYSSLTSITIPNSVTSIGEYAFYGCGSLTSVKVDIETPLFIYSSTFTNRANATLYVPAGSKAAYEAASYWQDFKEIVEFIDGDVNSDNEVDVVDVVDIARFVVGSPAETFVKILADINRDGNVNVADAVVLVNEIAGDQNFVKAWRAPQQNTNSEDVLTLTSTDNGMSLCMENERNYTAFQLDLYLPEGIDATNMLLNAQRKQGHQLIYNKVEEGHYRVAAISTSNHTFSGYEGELLAVGLEGVANEDICLRDIRFFTTDGEEHRFDDIVMQSGTTTDIASPQQPSNEEAQDIYDLQGRKMVNGKWLNGKSSKGIYIVNGKKIAF